MNPDEVSRICADDAVRSAVDEPAPPELLGTVLDLAEARRRRNRWRFLSAAAAVVVIAAGLFGGLRSIGGSTQVVKVPLGSGTAAWETVEGSSSVTGASASVAYSKELWGHAFEVLVDHIPIGTTCELYVVHPDGTRTEVAAWTTAHDEGHVWYAGSMPSTAGAISDFQITSGSQVLVTVTPT